MSILNNLKELERMPIGMKCRFLMLMLLCVLVPCVALFFLYRCNESDRYGLIYKILVVVSLLSLVHELSVASIVMLQILKSN